MGWAFRENFQWQSAPVLFRFLHAPPFTPQRAVLFWPPIHCRPQAGRRHQKEQLDHQRVYGGPAGSPAMTILGQPSNPDRQDTR